MLAPRTLAVTFGLLASLSSLAACKGKDKTDDTSLAPAFSSPATAEQQRATEAWLALVDGGQIAQSWTEAASYFKTTIDSPRWEQAVTAVRAPLGAVKSRKLQSATPATSVPGAPDGEYVVFTYATSFENKGAAAETVTPMKDKDGKWRVAGYFIK